MSSARASKAIYRLPVYAAQDVRVVEGANLGDAIAPADELLLDDVFALSRGAQREHLSVERLPGDRFRIAPQSDLGQPGAILHLDCALTLMSPDGLTTESLVLVETDLEGHIADIYLLPFAELVARTPYALVGIETQVDHAQIAQLACARFTRGTRITLASGEQRVVEDLRAGDRILTRDDGVQELRWIGSATVRAIGEFAPICIREGTLNNTADLIVSPDHRLFIYQRKDRLGAGRAELLVKARHLVNGHSVVVQDGGFVDYFQLLFDAHQIIYAEGIAAESTQIDTRSEPALPADMAAHLKLAPDEKDLDGLDVQEALLDRPDAAELLRRASRAH